MKKEYLVRSICGRKSVIDEQTLINHWDLTQTDEGDHYTLAEWIEAGRDMDHDFITDDGDRIIKLN